MKSKKLLTFLFIIFCFFFCTKDMNAMCTDKDVEELTELAEHIEFAYSLYENPDDGNVYSYNVSLYNFTNKFYINTNSNGMILSNNKSIFENAILLEEHRIYKFDIYASDKSKCPDVFLITKEVEIPTFNDFSLKKECDNYKDFYLCLPHYETKDITEEQFNDLLKKYIDNKKQKKLNTFEIIINFIVDNYIYFIGFGVITIIVIIVIIIKRKTRKLKI